MYRIYLLGTDVNNKIQTKERSARQLAVLYVEELFASIR
jgi:hypothetical protein